jgi:putative acetyltransferase
LTNPEHRWSVISAPVPPDSCVRKNREKIAMDIRTPLDHECASVEAVHRGAFPTDVEARLVKLLAVRGKATVSMAAVITGQIVGHILFSPATCESSESVATGLGLAPLAVLPEFQRRGIGGELVRAGLKECQRRLTPWVVVLGDPAYYGRFGFVPASRYGLTGEFGGGDAFQVIVFDENRRPARGGNVRYAAEFGELLDSAS